MLLVFFFLLYIYWYVANKKQMHDPHLDLWSFVEKKAKSKISFWKEYWEKAHFVLVISSHLTKRQKSDDSHQIDFTCPDVSFQDDAMQILIWVIWPHNNGHRMFAKKNLGHHNDFIRFDEIGKINCRYQVLFDWPCLNSLQVLNSSQKVPIAPSWLRAELIKENNIFHEVGFLHFK